MNAILISDGDDDDDEVMVVAIHGWMAIVAVYGVWCMVYGVWMDGSRTVNENA